MKIASIAKRQKIPQKFLELILSGLKQGGFVESRRGAEGGYMLAREPDQITVGEVLRFVEGSRNHKNGTKATGDTAFSDMWQSIGTAVSGVLDKTTFAELSREWKEKRSTYVPNWEI